MRELLNELCRRWGIEKKVREYAALSQWPHIVGEKIAQKAHPVGVEGGKLFVLVESASWRNELTFMKPEIIERLNRAVGASVIRDIVFTGRKGARG